MSTPTPTPNGLAQTPQATIAFTPTPTPTITPTNKPCIKPPRISFVDGNNSILKGRDCCCPDSVKIKCEYLNQEKKYTAKIINLGPAQGRIFPKSISFIPISRTQEIEFFTQFVCDDNQNRPLYNSRYILNINKTSDISIDSLAIRLLNSKIGHVPLDSSQYNVDIYNDYLVISFDNMIVPTGSRTLNFTISISGPQIINTFKQVSIAVVGVTTDTINLISINNPPSSIAIEKKKLQQGSNGIQTNIDINIPSTERKPETAKVNFFEGTIFYDAGGNRLVGDLDVTVAHFSALETDSLDSFPGGFFITDALNQQNQAFEESFYFYSAGFIAVEVTDQNNRQASFLSQNFNIESQINSNILNPNNNFDPIQPGDSIPLWSIGSDGVWKQESDVVVENKNGSLQSSFSSKHLTTYNFDWKTGPCPSTTINVSQFKSAIPNNGILYFDLYTDPSGAGANVINARFKLNPGTISDNVLTLTRYPNLPIRVTFYSDRQRLNKIGELQILNCGAPPVTPPPPSFTPTVSPTPSITPSITPTISLTPSITPSVTPTLTTSPTQTPLPQGVSGLNT